MKRQKRAIKNLLLDVDGVLTDGQFHYTIEGKSAKIFGPDDADGILLVKDFVNVVAVTGDKRGFPITKKRVEEDMGLPLHLVSTFERVAWMKENGFSPEETIYMGDGVFDAMVFQEVAYGIAPANAFEAIKKHADFVTKACGAEGAVAEACFHIMKKFFKPLDILNLSIKGKGGIWGKTHEKESK